MNSKEFFVGILLCIPLITGSAHAQDTSHPTLGTSCFRIETKDGIIFTAVLLDMRPDTLVFRSTEGVVVHIPSASLKEMVKIALPEDEHTGRSSEEAPVVREDAEELKAPSRARHSTSLLIIPTAYPEPANRFRFGLYEVFFPTASYGFADVVTATVGMSVFPLSDDQLYHGTVKISPYVSEHLALAVGWSLARDLVSAYSLPFAVATLNLGGPHGNFVTAGVFQSLSNNSTYMMGGAELPLSCDISAILEFVLSVDSRKHGYIAPGTRFKTGKFNIDAGVILPRYDDRYWFPWIGASVLL